MRGGPVVELVGLAGAGKSAVASRAAASLHRAGVACLERGPMLDAYRASPWRRRLLLHLPDRPERLTLLASALGLAARSAGLRGGGLARAEQLLLLARIVEAARRDAPQRVLLLDQGLVQEVASLTLGQRPASARTLAPVVGSVAPHLSAVVHLVVPPDLAAARLRARAGAESRFDRWPPQEALRRLRAHATQLTALVEALARAGIAVREVDGRRSPDACAAEVHDVAIGVLAPTGRRDATARGEATA